MKRLAVILIALVIVGCGLYFLDQYWIHRYDSVIAHESARYHVDADLVWSIAYEESYFRSWMHGKDGEIGLMQVTPRVAQDWASEKASATMQQQTAKDVENVLRDPQRNIRGFAKRAPRNAENEIDGPPIKEKRRASS